MAFLSVLFIVPCVLFVCFSYIYYAACNASDDVYASWTRLELSLEAKAEASALLSGYLVQSSLAGRETFDRMFGLWESVVLAESPMEKMEEGRRADSESYGIIAMARSSASGLNDRARRILDGLDSQELRLAADIKSYNDTLIRLISKGEDLYMGKLFIALTGCEDFKLYAAMRQEGG